MSKPINDAIAKLKAYHRGAALPLILKELVNAEDEIETDTIMPIFSDLDLVESVSVYRLTDKGREFLGVLRDMQEGE